MLVNIIIYNLIDVKIDLVYYLMNAIVLNSRRSLMLFSTVPGAYEVVKMHWWMGHFGVLFILFYF